MDTTGAESTRWMTGSFYVDFVGTDVSASGTKCAPHKATGQFGAPVCAGF
jgi:hypothetical protein